jgi:hypothetical protein
MEPLPRSLGSLRFIIAMFVVILAFQIYVGLTTPAGFDLHRFGQIALPLGCICMNLADYPRFKSTTFRKPLVMMQWLFLIMAVLFLLSSLLYK